MIQILYGDEPYGIEKRKKKVISGLSTPQMNFEMRQGKFDIDMQTACLTYPFLDDRKVILLDVESLKALDTKEFKDYLKAPNKTTDLIIIVRNVDQRLKMFKALKEAGLLVPCMKLKSEKELTTVLCAEIKSRGGQITGNAMSEFLKRLNYSKEGVNLLYAVGFIETLININKDIDEGMVKRYMPSNEEANEFWLSSLIKAKDADNLYKQLSLIPNDEDIKVLSLLLKDYRVAYKLKYFGEKEIGTARTEFAGLSKEMLNKAMNVITDGIYAIKSGYLPKEHALKSVCSQLLTIN